MEPSLLTAGTYYKNKVLELNVESSSGFLKAQSKVRLVVRELHQPWTLSCGMVAAVSNGTEEAAVVFLKLFDRRWAHQLRSDNGIQPWSRRIEKSFVSFVHSGQAADFFDKLKRKDGSANLEDDWDDAEKEAFLVQKLLSLYAAETATYDALQDYQGKSLPRLLAKVSLDLKPGCAGPGEQHMKVKGILLQYLAGFTLSELDRYVPRPAWQDVVDEAVRIARVLGDRNILNADVRPDNFIVVPMANEEYRVFMIDFGHCRFRRAHESDKEWGRAKWQQDEEGAIGMVMRQRLRQNGFEYRFEPSMRYLEWAPGEDD